MKSKPARRAFVEAEALTGLAHQIRVLRHQRQWTQAQLARHLGTTQAAISRLEDADYGKYSVRTLLDLAHAFDVGLCLRFQSIVDQMVEVRQVRTSDLEVEAFDDEAEHVGFHSPAALPQLEKQATTADPTAADWQPMPHSFYVTFNR